MATVQVLFNLCAMPDYVSALRLEAQAALENGGGVWNMESLKNLQKLDSFFKESQRVNPSTFLGFDRKVMSNIKLSDGTVIDAGETIAMPSGPMSQDHSYYTDPSKFDGYRFCHVTAEGQGQSPELEKEYTEIEPGNLSWGHGRFSCPGRWYASTVMKLLLATLILEYDFKFPDGQSRRPANYVMDVHVLPDMKQQVLFKKR
ncbi:MAG: hypothetical protein LQ339_007341 [Xanthoria mediterranea]|nr:MAG: hypothetical protein LQ339_007341 [Xanthoria mediterranea]